MERLSSEELKTQLDQQHDLVKKLHYLKLQQAAETVVSLQKGVSAMKIKSMPHSNVASGAGKL